MCPTGDDPKTVDTARDTNEIQTISCTATGGTFSLTFRGETTVAIAYNAGASTIQAALEALKTLYKGGASGDIAVAFTGGAGDKPCDADGETTTITFKTTTGDVPMLRFDSSSLTGTVSFSIAQSTQGNREDLICNGRGSCDYAIGQCTCYAISTTVYYLSGNGYSSGSVAQGTLGDCGYWPGSRASPYCPGGTACTSQGVCDTSQANSQEIDLCSCYTGFTGGDCALRTCPDGPAWWDEATAANTAHAMAECSNMGLCDRTTGKCTCRTGFEGVACQRTSCKDACSGRGACVSLKELAPLRASDSLSGGRDGLTAYTYGATAGKPETWDADMFYTCHCDAALYDGEHQEFGGPSCADFYCPYGDNPLKTTYLNTGVTPNEYQTQPNERQTIRCIASAGTFTITFRGETTPAIDYNAPASDDWVALSGLGTVTLTTMTNTFTASNNVASTITAGYYMIISGSSDLTTADTDIRFFHVTGSAWSGSVTTVTLATYFGGATLASSTDIEVRKYQMSVTSALQSLRTLDNVTVTFADTQVPPVTATTACLASGGVDILIDFGSEFGDLPPVTVSSTGLTSPTITITETQKGYKENSECSEKGVCDRSTGLCKCFAGYFSSDGYGNVGTRGDCGAFDANAAATA